MTDKTTVRCAIFREGKRGYEVLLGLRADSNLWEFPGGGVDENETELEAITREAREETNLIISDLREIFKNAGEDIFGNPNGTVQKLFATATYCGTLRPDGIEVRTLAWLALSEILHLETTSLTKHLLNVVPAFQKEISDAVLT